MKNALLLSFLTLSACVSTPQQAAEDVAPLPVYQRPSPTPVPELAPQAPIDMGEQAPIIIQNAPDDSDLAEDSDADSDGGIEAAEVVASPSPAPTPVTDPVATPQPND